MSLLHQPILLILLLPNTASLVAPDLSTERDWMYWLIGSTAASLLWTLLTSLALVFVVDILHDKQVKDLEKLEKKHKKLVSCLSRLWSCFAIG